MLAKHLRLAALICTALLITEAAHAVPPTARTCRRATIEGEVTAGQQFFKPIGNSLAFFLQPIASGWILRVIPATGPRGDHDYAELATPPYNSVTPLSISTDFAFRAQDAIGWNPRRFRYATSQASFDQLLQVFKTLPPPPASAPPSTQQQLGSLIAQASEGTFRILDSRLIPGTADQALTAGAVASHFTTTAHTLEQLQSPTPLGKLLWIRFRAELDLPAYVVPAPALKTVPSPCPVQP